MFTIPVLLLLRDRGGLHPALLVDVLPHARGVLHQERQQEPRHPERGALHRTGAAGGVQVRLIMLRVMLKT